MSETDTPPTENLEEVTEDSQKKKIPRTDAQIEALARAREKAMMVRRENAALRKKEREIDRDTLARAKQEKRDRIEREYQELKQKSPEDRDAVRTESKIPEDRDAIRTESKIPDAEQSPPPPNRRRDPSIREGTAFMRPVKEDEQLHPSPKKRRKPARKVIVTEASSASDTDDEVQVVLPRQKKSLTPEEVQFQRTYHKMFTYD